MHCGKPYLWKEVQHTNYLIDCSTGPRFKDFSILPLKEKRSCIARGVIDCKNPTWKWCRVSPRAPLDTNQIVVQSIINCVFQAIQSQGMMKLWISTISAIWDTIWCSIALPGGLYSPPSTACTALLVWVAGWRLPLLVQVVYPPPLLPHRLHCTDDDNDDDSDADDDVDDQSDEAGAQTLLVHPPNLLSSLTTWASPYHAADDQDDENNVEVNASYSTGPISNPALLPQHYIVI